MAGRIEGFAGGGDWIRPITWDGWEVYNRIRWVSVCAVAVVFYEDLFEFIKFLLLFISQFMASVSSIKSATPVKARVLDAEWITTCCCEVGEEASFGHGIRGCRIACQR